MHARYYYLHRGTKNSTNNISVPPRSLRETTLQETTPRETTAVSPTAYDPTYLSSFASTAHCTHSASP